MTQQAEAPKKPREKIPQVEVLDWLKTNHPQLHVTCEIDRAWVWITENLSGDTLKPVRESIKEYGFAFAKRGGHKLPSGNMGTWGHSCEKPLPFRRKGFKPKGDGPSSQTAQPSTDNDLEKALAFALGQ